MIFIFLIINVNVATGLESDNAFWAYFGLNINQALGTVAPFYFLEIGILPTVFTKTKTLKNEINLHFTHNF